MNLSAWRYRNILARDGGPLNDIGFRERGISQGIDSFNADGFEAWATLRTDLKPSHFRTNKIYGDCDGSGWARYQHEAVYKAISESMERWAFYTTFDSINHNTYGFDLDPSTSGMAAYPGITCGRAREKAKLEAIERWTICQWWEGRAGANRLSAESLPNETCGFEILSPWKEVHVVILYSKSIMPYSSYGFSCGKTLSSAIIQARIEQLRNVAAMATYYMKENMLHNSGVILDLYERRLLHFAREGSESFFNCLDRSLNLELRPAEPQLTIDCEIKGPWTHYAAVWRCLLDPRGSDVAGTSGSYFLF